MDSRRTFFDRHADTWDEALHYDERTAPFSQLVKGFGLSEGDSVLDVGTGTGVLLPLIRESIGPRGRLMAMDYSRPMLEKARRRPCPGGRVLIHAGVDSIPFQANRFDHVTCFSAFPHFPNKAKALFEMVRVLRTDGKLTLAHLKSAEEINAMHRQMGGAVGHDQLPHTERLRGLMTESGLWQISIVNEPGKFLAQGRKI